MKKTLILLLSMLLFTACKEKPATSIEPDKAGTPVSVHKYTTKIPPALVIADKVETRIGTLTFKGGFPDDSTVQKVYDNLDFQRGVQAFLTAMPAASLYAMREGSKSVGVNSNSVLVF